MFGTGALGLLVRAVGLLVRADFYSIFFFISLFYPPVGQKPPENNDLNKNTSYKALEIFVLIAYANSKGLDETTCTHPCSFVRAFIAHTLKTRGPEGPEALT